MPRKATITRATTKTTETKTPMPKPPQKIKITSEYLANLNRGTLLQLKDIMDIFPDAFEFDAVECARQVMAQWELPMP